MDNQHEAPKTPEYHIGTTKYTVTSVFCEAAKKESIEEKIKRLILQDKKQKGAKS